jgi:hypothetical protein
MLHHCVDTPPLAMSDLGACSSRPGAPLGAAPGQIYMPYIVEIKGSSGDDLVQGFVTAFWDCSGLDNEE